MPRRTLWFAGLSSQRINVIDEVAAMRKSLFVLLLLLAACGNDGTGSSPSGGGGSPLAQHVPEITSLTLSPNKASYMEGNGEVTVSAQLTFLDMGKDVQTLWVQMPDGQRLQFSQATGMTTGTLTEQFNVSTATVGELALEVWVVDKAGYSSFHTGSSFAVVVDVLPSEWTSRLSGLPFALNDVVWNGTNFVAVGDGGKILTSTDGVAWVERQSGTDVDLGDLAFYGSEIVAVGSDATVLLSVDDGVNWTTKHSASRVSLSGVAINAALIVAGGMDLETGNAFIVRSLDRGTSWAGVESWPRADHFVRDIVYANGLFVAGTYAYDNDWTSDARVMVSADGGIWHEVIVQEDVEEIHAVWYCGSQFIAAGTDSTLFASLDGYKWTKLHTPVDRVDYLSAAWNGSRLIVAGGITWWYWWLGTPAFERPAGLSSVDGGVAWEIFNIDGYYQSNGMAWGNGRFVSVGQSTPNSGLGAIYTSD
jgi:ribosomal protein L27